MMHDQICSQQNVMAMDDQDKLLTEALNQVKKNTFEMKTCLVRFRSVVMFFIVESTSSADGYGLQYASNMLSELRTSLHSCKGL